MAYSSIKTYGHEVGLSCAFRQWRADSHCSFLHGYALSIEIEFQSVELDERNWVIDFGGMKALKQRLVDTFDHKTVIAVDDPEFSMFADLHRKGLIDMVEVEATGCEAFAKLVHDIATKWLDEERNDIWEGVPRVWVGTVTVREHGANAASYHKQ